ncbi:MAG: hypothetical protein E6Q88_10190 [Lysobacteraceae bacterium]|nr:MAG: hypothetical protein E6Q88_10190 [Xanthomonadaceae bacterium]
MNATTTRATQRVDTQCIKPGLLRRLWRLALTAVALHLFVASQIMAIFGVAVAIAYAIFPPVLGYIAYDLVWRGNALLALLITAPVLTVVPWLHATLQAALARLPRVLRLMAWMALIIWLSVAGGEIVRWLLMQIRIGYSPPQCHDSSLLISSLRQRYAFFDFDHRPHPHAWLIRDDVVWLWSYKRLDFVAAPAWSGTEAALSQCHSATTHMPASSP